MVIMISSRIIYSVLFYVLSVLLILVSKPAAIFNTDGELRPFGVGDGKTIFAFGVVVVALAIISFYVFCVIDLVFGTPGV